MFIGTLPTTLLQISSRIFLDSKVIVESIFGPDDNFQKEPLSISE